MTAALRYDRGTILYEGDEAGAALLAPYGFIPDARIANRLRAPARMYRLALAALVRAGLQVEDQARGYQELSLVARRTRTPHPHQTEAIEAWMAGGRRGVVVLPTGAGKSYVAEMAIARVQRSTLVIAPTIDLMNQWVGLLQTAFGPEQVGSLGGGTYDLKPLTATTYDSAHLHVETLGDRYGLIVFDECHHLPSPAYALAADGMVAPFRLGLTATPERGDGSESRLVELVGKTVYRRDIQDLKGEYLAAYETIRVRVDLTEGERQLHDEARATYRGFVERHRISMGSPEGWGRFLQTVARTGQEGRAAFSAWRAQRQTALRSSEKLSVLESLFVQHAHEPMIIFCADNDTVHHISRTWLVPALTHETPGPERKQVLEDFNAGRIRAVVTARVLNEGVDLPTAQIGVVLAGTATVREHVQRLGRLLRKQGDKTATLYEIITGGTAEEHVSDRRREHGAYR